MFGLVLIVGVLVMLVVGVFNFKVLFVIVGLGLNGFIVFIVLVFSNLCGLLLVVVFGIVVFVISSLIMYYLLKKVGKMKVNDLYLDVV